jgi:hypothetical protein
MIILKQLSTLSVHWKMQIEKGKKMMAAAQG